MNVDSLAGIKQFLFTGFGKTNTHASHKVSTTADQMSFATLLGNARKILPHSGGNGATPNLIEDVMAAADPQKAQTAQVALLESDGTSRADGKADAKSKAMLALEGTLMTKFVDEMLPKSNNTLYGSGIAGDTWRGFEVDQFGAVLAKSDPLNMASSKGGVKLAASAAVANLFGNGFDEPQPGQSITPFSS